TLGMGNRGYYLVDDASHQPVQRAYIETAAKLLAHSGRVERDAAQAAERVFAFETELASKTWSQEESLDFDKILVVASLPDLESLYPAMDWSGYFAALGLKTTQVTVTEERYLASLGSIVETTP